jgi:hypothetical protein
VYDVSEETDVQMHSHETIPRKESFERKERSFLPPLGGGVERLNNKQENMKA